MIRPSGVAACALPVRQQSHRAYFGGQVERFNAVYNPQALFVVAKSVWADFVQRGFPRVTERGVPRIMTERNRFREYPR